MDISITTMTSTHFFIAGTLFSVLLLWIFLFALLALRPEAKTKVEEPATETSLAQPVVASTVTAPATTVSSVENHMYETGDVEVAQVF